jgi:hypothetical protein
MARRRMKFRLASALSYDEIEEAAKELFQLGP